MRRLLGMTTKLSNRRDVLDLIEGDVGTDSEIVRHSPEEDLDH